MSVRSLLDAFIEAIHQRRKVLLTFAQAESAEQVTRLCAPMDYGPKKREKVPVDRFHLWDYEGTPTPHTLSIEEDQIVDLVVLNEAFDPGEFVSWAPDWHIPRDWGPFS